jgi:CheY-like chemotaxis protein
VSAVWNGQEALDYLIAPDKPQTDVICMDVQMPILDGYKATHILRHDEPYISRENLKNIPIIAMTASAIQGDKEKCQRAGMNDYLSKPVRGNILERMLVKWAIRSRNRNSALPEEFSIIPTHPTHRSSTSTIRAPHHQAPPHQKPVRPGPSTLKQTQTPDSPSPSSDHSQVRTKDDKAFPVLKDARVPVSADSMITQAQLDSGDLEELPDAGKSPGSKQHPSLDRSTESENSRTMRRLWNEEKAMALRDDKLLNITEEDRGNRERSHVDAVDHIEARAGSSSGHQASSGAMSVEMGDAGRPGAHRQDSDAPMLASQPPRSKLTKANMSQLASEIQADDDRRSMTGISSDNETRSAKSLSSRGVR